LLGDSGLMLESLLDVNVQGNSRPTKPVTKW